MRQRAGAVALAAGCILLFGLLSLLEIIGATERLDLWADAQIDPDQEWREKADQVVRAFEPVRLVAAAMALALVIAVWRGRMGPLLLTLGVVGAASVAEVGVKWVVPRFQAHEPVHYVGSFPSGHVTVTLSCAGALVLAVGAVSRWWVWTVVAVIGAAMGAGLLIMDWHQLTDVVGGALIAVGTLALAVCVAPGLDRGVDHQYEGQRSGTPASGARAYKNRPRRSTPPSIL